MAMASVTTQQHNKAEVVVSMWACTICGEQLVEWCVPIQCVPFLSFRVTCTGSGVAYSVDGERVRWSHMSSN